MFSTPPSNLVWEHSRTICSLFMLLCTCRKMTQKIPICVVDSCIFLDWFCSCSALSKGLRLLMTRESYVWYSDQGDVFNARFFLLLFHDSYSTSKSMVSCFRLIVLITWFNCTSTLLQWMLLIQTGREVKPA